MKNINGLFLAFKIWIGYYEKELELKLLIQVFLNALKYEIKKNDDSLLRTNKVKICNMRPQTKCKSDR